MPHLKIMYFLLLHRAVWKQFITHQRMHCYNVIVWNLYTKTFKTLLHVSILRSSSGSTYRSLLKLYVKTINTFFWWCSSISCVCVCVVSLAGRSVDWPHCKGYSMICCCITRTYNKAFIILTYNFSKEWAGSIDSTATAYRLDGPGIESRWGRDFPYQSRPALRPTQPPVQWAPGLSRG